MRRLRSTARVRTLPHTGEYHKGATVLSGMQDIVMYYITLHIRTQHACAVKSKGSEPLPAGGEYRIVISHEVAPFSSISIQCGRKAIGNGILTGSLVLVPSLVRLLVLAATRRLPSLRLYRILAAAIRPPDLLPLQTKLCLLFLRCPHSKSPLNRRNVCFPRSSTKLRCKNHHNSRFFREWSLVRHIRSKTPPFPFSSVYPTLRSAPSADKSHGVGQRLSDPIIMVPSLSDNHSLLNSFDYTALLWEF